jgi:hypothetical protein
MKSAVWLAGRKKRITKGRNGGGKGQGTHCTALVRVSFGVLEKGC